MTRRILGMVGVLIAAVAVVGLGTGTVVQAQEQEAYAAPRTPCAPPGVLC